MGDTIKIALEILSEILPDSDIGKLGGLLLFSIFVLILFGRIKLEWMAYWLRHIFRWLRCKIRGKHLYFLDGTGRTDLWTGLTSGTFVCAVCGRVEIAR